MRLSRSATNPQNVDLYVLAEHRMDPAVVPDADEKPSLEFAGPIGSADVSPALAEYVGDAAFLTRWKNTIFEPASIDGDYVFEQAPSDITYQEVIYRTRDRGDLTGLILLGVLGVGGIVTIVLLARLLPRKSVRR